MAAEAVSNDVWPRLSELIAQLTGLHFPQERHGDLQRGLATAATGFGFDSTASLANWLLSASLTRAQRRVLASHLTVGETYFFRDRKTFDALAQVVLPELLGSRRGGEQRLRLWSAGCSTGEEAYSLAILIHEALPDWHDWNITVLATDINERFLQKAVAGIYGEWSFRGTVPEFRERYFSRLANGRFALCPEIRSCVSFAPMNLVEDPFPSLVTDTSAMDVILCRNVLMYFAPTQARKVVGGLRNALTDEGWLAVSASECSQSLFSDFVAVNVPGSILYRKGHPKRHSSAESPSSLMHETAHDAPIPEPGERTIQPVADTFDAGDGALEEDWCGQYKVAEELYRRGCYTEAADALLALMAGRAAADTASTPAATPQVLSLVTRALANRGDLSSALMWSERWIEQSKLDPFAHYLHAMVLQESGERDAARRALNRAIYLQPNFALAHLTLANLTRADAGNAAAQRHLRNALRSLEGMMPDEVLPESEGITVGRLTETVATLLSLSAEATSTEEAGT